MGFRMSIRSEQSDKWIGDDHKFYGYFAEYRESTQRDPAEIRISWKEEVK